MSLYLMFNETRGAKNLPMDEGSPKSSNLEFTSLDTHIGETMEI